MKKELSGKKLFLLDLDGTLYLDGQLFVGTLPFLDAVKRNGARAMYLTNNSSRSVDAYISKLCGMGIQCTAEDFVTSVDATIVYLKENMQDKLLYAFGTASFRTQLTKAGLTVTDRLSDDVGALVMGFDTELTFQKLEDACILLGRGIPYIAANPDLVCPTSYGYVPDCGSVSEMLFHATGRKPHFIGKPESAMLTLAMKIAGSTKKETVFIGDRIYTDIASGINAGIDTVLVLSGEGTEVQAKELGILPTWVFSDIGEVAKQLSSLTEKNRVCYTESNKKQKENR